MKQFFTQVQSTGEEVVIEERAGSQFDHQLEFDFKEHIECDILDTGEVKTAEDFERVVNEARVRMRNESYGILFFGICTHERCGGFGQSLLMSNLEAVSVSHDLIDRFSKDECPWMEGKAAVFFVNACTIRRRFGGKILV